ncbi:hypothetical protein [Sediminicola arcticus]|jgi:hypothetical protein|uniref:Secreted protein n=1 Tax=Sediminicola arcticus TaxID=1574308 RepID=A0ABV2SRQ2_9FLAO
MAGYLLFLPQYWFFIIAMKFSLVLTFFFLFTLQSFGQIDGTIKSIKIENGNKNFDIKPSNQGAVLKFPSILDKKPDYNLKDSLMARNVKMLPDTELKQAGYDLKIDPKVRERESPNSGAHYGDMYLGDVKTSSKFVGIVCRDHEFVDGDRVKIMANDEIVEPNLFLTASFKGINVDLNKGFNRLDFEALNQGSSGPNTAQVDVYDDKGNLIYSNRWNLSTGSKASLIIVKD